MKKEPNVLELEPTDLSEEELEQIEKEFWDNQGQTNLVAFLKFISVLAFAGLSIGLLINLLLF